MTIKMFDPLASLLAARANPVSVFFRDDDAGWADQRLIKLCACFTDREIPLDIAAIPSALKPESMRTMTRLLAQGQPWLHVHQHGYTHFNHQQQGRSCEFGTDRSLEQQRDDIAQGQNILQELFGSHSEPIFTPPWNRCTYDTTVVLESLKFRFFSRIINSEPILTELPELNVSIDLLKKRKGVRLPAAEIAQMVCRVFEEANEPVGVMLHHEHMGDAERNLLVELIHVLQNSSNVVFTPMHELIAQRWYKHEQT